MIPWKHDVGFFSKGTLFDGNPRRGWPSRRWYHRSGEDRSCPFVGCEARSQRGSSHNFLRLFAVMPEIEPVELEKLNISPGRRVPVHPRHGRQKASMVLLG